MRSSSAALTSLSLFPTLGLAFQFHVKVEPVNVVTDRNPSAIRAYYNQWLNRDAEGTPNQGLVTITKDPWRGFQDEPGVGRGVNFETYSSLAGEDDRFKSFDEWITREDGRIKSMDYFEMKMEGGSGDNAGSYWQPDAYQKCAYTLRDGIRHFGSVLRSRASRCFARKSHRRG